MSPTQLFRPRGWLLLAVALTLFWLAYLLGRRDLLTLSIFCFALPAVAYASLHFFKPGFTLKRTLSPRLGRVGQPVEVTLEVHGRNPGGSSSRLTEELPFSFRDAPTFTAPQPVAPHSLRSDYFYTLHPAHRGVFTIGPLRGIFTDPFDVAALRRGLDDGDLLTIAPAAEALPAISLTQGRGQDGSQASVEQAHARQDDVMTRDYRYGDPLRRVHWPVSARQGKLMVRAEESVTTPEATLILDRRHLAFGDPQRNLDRFRLPGLGAAGPGSLGQRPTTQRPTSLSAAGLPEMVTTAAFESAIVATASVTAHLIEHNFAVTLLDHRATPALLSSKSAPEPSREEFSGAAGNFDVAAGLAALELGGPQESTLPAILAERLHSGDRRGPLFAVMGALTVAEAQLLASCSATAQSAYALLLCNSTAEAEPAVQILRRAGWHVSTLTPADTLRQAWAILDSGAGGGSQ